MFPSFLKSWSLFFLTYDKPLELGTICGIKVPLVSDCFDFIVEIFGLDQVAFAFVRSIQPVRTVVVV